MAEAPRQQTSPRPWIDHYPEGITWDVPINTTPGARAGAGGLRQQSRCRRPRFPRRQDQLRRTGQGDHRLCRRAADPIRRQEGHPRRAAAAQYALSTSIAYYARAAGRRHRGQLQPALYGARTRAHRRQCRRRPDGHARPASRSSRRPRRWSRPATSSSSSSATSPTPCPASRSCSSGSSSARIWPSSRPRRSPTASPASTTCSARNETPDAGQHRPAQGHRGAAIYRRHHRHCPRAPCSATPTSRPT